MPATRRHTPMSSTCSSLKGSRRARDASGRRPKVSYLTEGRLVACGLVAATQMSWGSVVPALPHYTLEFGMGAIGLGGIIAAFGLGRLLVNPRCAPTSARRSRRPRPPRAQSARHRRHATAAAAHPRLSGSNRAGEPEAHARERDRTGV